MSKCIGLNKNGCSRLSVRECAGSEKCSFFQTKEQSESAILKSLKRIAGLNPITQRHIAEAYYGGKYPWLRVI